MPESATRAGAGLFVSNTDIAVPLLGVSVEAEISNLCARTVLSQRFVNRETTPIEAVYLFPLPEGAAVCGFEAVVDDTLVVGEVKDRGEAFKLYDEAMERGHGGFLLDEERPDVFQVSVGNLPPGEEALLRITYVMELAVNDEAVRFTIPTTVSPRYAPAEDHVAIGRPDSDTLNPPVAWTVPYGLELKVHLAMSGGVERVESPSHAVAVAIDGGRATVSLSQRETALDRDFVLAIDARAFASPQGWVERTDDGGTAIAVAFVPKLSQTPAPSEVIFVVDRSGSMEGTSIAEVRNALQLCLRSLVPGCRFNIIGFGSSVDPLFPESRAYDDVTLREAGQHVAELKADLGGTELLPALKRALAGGAPDSLPRQLVVLTDGEVTNTDAVLHLARQHAAHTRIFTFGIGAGASHHLVNGLARAAGGSAEFIAPGERIEPQVIRQCGRLLSAALTNVRVDWGGLEVTQSPVAVAPVFTGERLMIYGFVRDTAEVPRATVRLAADAREGRVAFEVPVDIERAESGRTVATLAARARICELEESPDWLMARGSQQRGRKESGVSREIIDLATRFGLVSRETSYVAVEKRDQPLVGDVQLRRVPIAMTKGWGGLRVDFAASYLPVGDVLHASMPRVAPPAWADAASTAESRLFHPVRPSRALRLGGHDDARSEPPVVRAMHAVVRLQRADGAWELTRDLAMALGYDLRNLEPTPRSASGDRDEARTAWATALALAWLERHAGDLEDQWRFLARKALEWLRQATAMPADGETWEELASEVVRHSPPPSELRT